MPNALTAASTSKRKFLMLGNTGAGKTTQFLTLPGKKFMYLFDANAILSIQGHDVDYEEFLPDKLNLSVRSLSKDKGDKATNYASDIFLKWEKDFDAKLSSGFFDQYDVIGMDSATTFLDLIMDRVMAINGRSGWPQQDDYGPQMVTFTNVCRVLAGLDKIIYMTGHLETKQDELTKRIYRGAMMTGRLKTKIPLLFSDVFFCDVANDGQGKIDYRLNTVPDRTNEGIRTSFKGLKPFENVTLDFTKPLGNQGLGKLMQDAMKGQPK